MLSERNLVIKNFIYTYRLKIEQYPGEPLFKYIWLTYSIHRVSHCFVNARLLYVYNRSWETDYRGVFSTNKHTTMFHFTI